MEVRANPMPDGGIVTTFTDITPTVKAAEELERANESLERRVQERTEELTRLNTELGVLIESPELARQVIARFNAIAQPANSYVPVLVTDASGKQTLIWRTEEGGKLIELTTEPMGDLMKGVKVDLLTLLPLDDLL